MPRGLSLLPGPRPARRPSWPTSPSNEAARRATVFLCNAPQRPLVVTMRTLVRCRRHFGAFWRPMSHEAVTEKPGRLQVTDPPKRDDARVGKRTGKRKRGAVEKSARTDAVSRRRVVPGRLPTRPLAVEALRLDAACQGPRGEHMFIYHPKWMAPSPELGERAAVSLTVGRRSIRAGCIECLRSVKRLAMTGPLRRGFGLRQGVSPSRLTQD